MLLLLFFLPTSSYLYPSVLPLPPFSYGLALSPIFPPFPRPLDELKPLEQVSPTPFTVKSAFVFYPYYLQLKPRPRGPCYFACNESAYCLMRFFLLYSLGRHSAKVPVLFLFSISIFSLLSSFLLFPKGLSLSIFPLQSFASVSYVVVPTSEFLEFASWVKSSKLSQASQASRVKSSQLYRITLFSSLLFSFFKIFFSLLFSSLPVEQSKLNYVRFQFRSVSSSTLFPTLLLSYIPSSSLLNFHYILVSFC